MSKNEKSCDNGLIALFFKEKHGAICVKEEKTNRLLIKFLTTVKESLLLKAQNRQAKIEHCLGKIKRILKKLLVSLKIQDQSKIEFIKDFIFFLDKLKEDYIKDVSFAYESDPSIDDYMEIIATYPGVNAIFIHRIAHFFYERGVKLLPRLLAELAHSQTGIDIHPGAKIASPCFIDHGTGIVIGETAIVGERVKLYQGVTLGALSLSEGRALKGVKRHPTILNGVTIYANATVLGGDTVVGENSVVACGVTIKESVKNDFTVILKNKDD